MTFCQIALVILCYVALPKPDEISKSKDLISIFKFIYLLKKCRELCTTALTSWIIWSCSTAITENATLSLNICIWTARSRGHSSFVAGQRIQFYRLKMSCVAPRSWLEWWLNHSFDGWPVWFSFRLISCELMILIKCSLSVSAPVSQAQTHFMYLTPCFPLGSKPFFSVHLNL